MSKIELWVKQSKKYPTTTSVVLNEYRVGGVKWNDIDNGNVIITNVDKDDILVALGVDKQIAELNQQLEEATENVKAKDILIDTYMLVVGTLDNAKNLKQKLHTQPKEIVERVKKYIDDNACYYEEIQFAEDISSYLDLLLKEYGGE